MIANILKMVVVVGESEGQEGLQAFEKKQFTHKVFYRK